MLKKLLPKNKFFRGFVVVASGTAGAQALLVIAAPLLTRLYTPEQFGVLAAYSSIIGILTINAAFRYELAIPLAKNKDEVNAVLKLCLLITIALSCVLALLGFAGGAELLRTIGGSDLVTYWWLIPMGLLGAGIYQTLMQWGVRERAYASIAQTKLIRVLGQLSVQGFVGVVSGGAAGLLIGQFVGVSAGITKLAKQALKVDRKILLVGPVNIIVTAAKVHRRFPMYMGPAGLLNAGTRFAPQLLIATLYGVPAAGAFYVADRVVGAPITLVGGSLAQVYYGEAAAIYRAGKDVSKLFRSIVIRLFVIGIVPAILLFAYGDNVFPIVFGENWSDGGEVISLLAPLLLARFVVSPVAQTLSIAKRQNVNMFGQLVLFVLAVGAIIGGHEYGLELFDVILVYSIATAVGYIFFFVLTYRAVHLMCAERFP